MAETKVRNILNDLEISEADADALIAQYIRRDPARHGRDRVRTGTEAWTIPVWQVIAYLEAADISTVASEYDVSEEAVKAAIAYYRRHRALIDARILLQNEQFIRG
jgi:uncharacterized protein (DUF433 family)